MDTLKIGLIIGSTRDGRFAEHAASFIQTEAAKHPKLEVTVIDLKDVALPFLTDAASPSHVTDGAYGTEAARAFAKTIDAQDGFIVTAAEYNHGYTAVLKNAFDSVFTEWKHKPIGFVSYGSVGGARAVEQLRQVAVELQMASTRTGVHIMAPWFLRDETGALKPNALESYEKAADTMLTELTWWGTTLKAGRAGN